MTIEENENITKIKEEINSTTKELEREIEKLRDPTVHASIMYAVVRERENTNRILKNLLARIELLEKMLQAQTHPKVQAQQVVQKVLSSIDQTIIEHIKSKGPSTAEDIKKIFRYKGRNAACARLSRLADLGLLNRQRSGKVIYYAAL